MATGERSRFDKKPDQPNNRLTNMTNGQGESTKWHPSRTKKSFWIVYFNYKRHWDLVGDGVRIDILNHMNNYIKQSYHNNRKKINI